MRYYHPPLISPIIHFGRSIKEWSITRVLLLLGVPLMAVVLLIMTFSTYQIAKHYLVRAYARNSQTRALAQAYELKQMLLEARNELLYLARTEPTADSVRQYWLHKPVAQRNRYREVAFHSHSPARNFVLLNTGEHIWQLPDDQASASKFGVFSRQENDEAGQSNFVQIEQPVQVYYSSVPHNESMQNLEISVIRLTTRAYDALGRSAGIVTLSVDLGELQKIMHMYSSQQSPLYIFPQEKERVLSFFFDEAGWMLFESGANGGQRSRLSIDALRSGLQGDIGRPGFDSAFRPSPLHERYWTMVTSVQAGKSGQLALGSLFKQEYSGDNDLFVNYAPVDFPEDPSLPPSIIGGIGCIDTSFMFKSAIYEVVMALSVALLAFILLSMCAFFYLNRRISRPLRILCSAIEKRALNEDTSHLDLSPLPKELQNIQHTVNVLLMQLQSAKNEIGIRQCMMLDQLQRQPVSLDEIIAQNRAVDQNQVSEPLCGIVGGSQAVRNLYAMIQKASQVMADVLIVGETGTGKELTAEAIHHSSPLASGPFLSINCGALDENLLLDALFGHVKGAFSEAKEDRKGAFQAASGGTLHLDEIGNASPKVQQALLRALSVRHIRPLGSDQDIPFTARVIAATNVDLLECAKNGTFREDLYYRLAVITINTPSLRQRKEDLPALVRYFLRQTAAHNKNIELSRGALEKIMNYDWPGNIRELKNCITRSVAFMDGNILLEEHISLGRAAEPTSAQNSESIQPKNYDEVPTTDVAETPDEAESSVASSHGDYDDVLEMLNLRQREAWPDILREGGTNRASYQRMLGSAISVRTAQYDLQDFVSKGLLRKKGRGPSLRYVLARSEQ
ncbi:MAG: sigma-54-dependent Fis family transcriptional regulator [Desulfovibrionales bacterium]|nr:sigma-54-dependent Fis family transcriptional regulator [Desulfovibrionales bacterium]